jgi:hypothetical protein
LVVVAQLFLTVPFSEKDQAKALGARWDSGSRSWYVPDGLPSAPFAPWLPSTDRWNVRARRYWIVSSNTGCWKCDRPTTAFTLAVPSGHETLEGDDLGDEWVEHGHLALLSYVTDVSPEVLTETSQICIGWGNDFSKTTQGRYWMNHCRSCGIKQGDFSLHSEPGGAFFPLENRDVANWVFHPVARPLNASADTSVSTLLLDLEAQLAVHK